MQKPIYLGKKSTNAMRYGDNIPASKRLRREMTEAEKRLWYLLRDRRFAHAKFRRQHAIGPFVADFVCLKYQLIIEVDGGKHAENAASDAKRTMYLAKEGFTVLRFWNNEVLENQESVLSRIAEHLCPHPNPLPHAGEGTLTTPPHPARHR